MRTITCARCAVSVETDSSQRRYCAPCARIVDRENKRRYARSEAGKAATRRATARWLATPAGQRYVEQWVTDHPDAGAIRQQRRRTKPGVRIAEAAAQRRRYETPEGRAKAFGFAVARMRGVSTKNYRRIVQEIGEGSARCYMCNGPAEEVDHVLPIAFARRVGLLHEVDRYVAAICHACHVWKTRLDMRDIRSLIEDYAK